MLLLALLAVGMLSLASVQLRTGDRMDATREARSNARMALMLALGELQQHAGPDQRITASGNFGRESGDAPIAHPRWTTVWKSTMPDGSPVITRDGEQGGLRDERNLSSWNPREDPLAQLVSGNEVGLRYRANGGGAEEDGQMERLVGEGTVGPEADETTAHVRAPRVAVTRDERRRGEYAWWVGDLGVKANVSTPDPFADKSGSSARIRRMQIAQDASLAAISDLGDAGNEQRRRMLSHDTLALMDDSDTFRAKSFHDLTTESRSVLADVRRGGLKKDLTAYLLGDGSVPDMPGDGLASLGLSDSDNLIGPASERAVGMLPDGGQAERLSEISPSFGLLRDWSRRALSTPFSMNSMDMDPAPTTTRHEDIFGYGGHNDRPARFRNLRESGISPVLAEGSIYYNLSYYRTDDPDPRRGIGLRLHLYPRVSLWNPYNFDLEVTPSMLAMQINGAKQIEVTLQNQRKQSFRMSWGRLQNENGNWSRWRRGTHYFRLPGVTIPPGSTVTFSPAANQPYNNRNLAANLLSPGVSPGPARSFYMDKREDGDPLFKVRQTFPPTPGIANNRLTDVPVEWREHVPPMPTGSVQAAGYTQADDYFMFWKPMEGSPSSMSLRDFNRLPHGRFVSCAFQYGDEDEMPVEWSSRDPVFFRESTSGGVTTQTPDRRTRDGFRLRWFREHPSNLMGSGSLSGTPHFDSAPIANWNVRASYSFRSAFENVTDQAPHFFGIYTRDLFDDAVSWNSLMPRSRGGIQRGDPFDQPVSGMPRVLFDVPRNGAEVVSLGAFQHLQFSELVWHPTYAFGNSLADPRIDRAMTEPDRSLRKNNWEGGWNRDTIGYTTDGRSNNPRTYNSDSWAHYSRGLLRQIVHDQNVVFDLSYELNHSLWDHYFLSTGNESDKRRFASEPGRNPLPNGRMRLIADGEGVTDDLRDFHRAASVLMLDGGFNVNSTSVDAWEATLLSNLGTGGSPDRVVVPRILEPHGDEWEGRNADDPDAWSGRRSLSREEIRDLAEAIVEEVERRGPFLSKADFVNRRLVDDGTGRMGAVEAALQSSGINSAFHERWPLDNDETLPDYPHPENIEDPTRIDQSAKPESTAWGALGYITQADLLQSLGPALTVRSDSFIIRAYGNALDADGDIAAEAWCEAVVQRTPEPLRPDESGINPIDSEDAPDFGRRFEIRRFRWLKRGEV